jgi:hypothetical protein
VIWWVDNDKDMLNLIVKNTGIVSLILVEKRIFMEHSGRRDCDPFLQASSDWIENVDCGLERQLDGGNILKSVSCYSFTE